MTLNQRVLDAVERHMPVTRLARVAVLACREELLLFYLRTAYHEIGEVLREYDNDVQPTATSSLLP